jgi:hypothetical protein
MEKARDVELSNSQTIVTLHSLDGTTKPSEHMSKKFGEDRKSIIFQATRKCPKKIGTIINND